MLIIRLHVRDIITENYILKGYLKLASIIAIVIRSINLIYPYTIIFLSLYIMALDT